MGTGKKIALGCGVAAIAFIALIVGIFFVVMRMTAAPEQVVRDFLGAAAAGDYAQAHAHFAAPLKERQPLDQFQTSAQSSRSLFEITDMTFNERNIDMSGARLSGTVTLKAGTQLPASFELVREGDTWKLIAYQLGSRQ